MEFYRYRDMVFVDLDGTPQHLEVVQETFYLVRETPCGWWIHHDKHYDSYSFIRPVWVSKTARKRYAYPTREEALESFRRRKQRQIQILKFHLHKAESALIAVDRPNRRAPMF